MYYFKSIITLALLSAVSTAFTIQQNRSPLRTKESTILKMSFYSDSSDYKSPDDFESSEDETNEFGIPVGDGSEDDSPTIEESPVPMSKNAGNRFLAFVFDKALVGDKNADPMKLHEQRIGTTEDHVMFCRKANLYNETFNTESMADILWSHQLLSADVKRTVGHVLCIESTSVQYAKDVLSRDPIVQKLTGGDISEIPFYRWRQIRDYTLRTDDGRDGLPNLLIAMDRSAEEGTGNLRNDLRDEFLEYLIKSERIISAGPMHLCTDLKDDPSSIAVGDFIIFNAKDRNDAIEFAENTPTAKAGLYESMKLHRFNSLDVTGKFVATNLAFPEKTKHTEDMKEALEYWGYPVDDRQTKWLNW